jgi:hypothetical protein
MTSIPSDPGHPMRGFTEIDNTADEPGKRRRRRREAQVDALLQGVTPRREERGHRRRVDSLQLLQTHFAAAGIDRGAHGREDTSRLIDGQRAGQV